MRNHFLIYAILISIGVHFVFLLNIKFDISNNKLLDIQLVKIPPEISKDNLSQKNNFKKEIKEESLSNKLEIKEEEIYCELCKPIRDIIEPIDVPVFGVSIKSISMMYKVLHDLGPNKGSISRIQPFGIDGQGITKNRNNLISTVGNLKINYKINKNNYEINYEAKAEGISSLFYSSPLIQKSSGSIGILGLRPDYYLYSHGVKKKSEALFNWENKILTINRKKTSNKYALIDQAQDQLSFMFQFMFIDPLNKMQIPITNAKVFKIYNYHYIDEVTIDTNLGNLEVLHVAKFDYQKPERIDFWLAKKYGYLPVKISITEADLSAVIQKIQTLNIKKDNE